MTPLIIVFAIGFAYSDYAITNAEKMAKDQWLKKNNRIEIEL